MQTLRCTTSSQRVGKNEFLGIPLIARKKKVKLSDVYLYIVFLGSKSIGGIVTLKKREHPTRGLSLVYFGVFHRKKLPKLDSQIKKNKKKHINV